METVPNTEEGKVEHAKTGGKTLYTKAEPAWENQGSPRFPDNGREHTRDEDEFNKK